MIPFLKIIADQIPEKDLQDLKNQTFLFPSRRAGQYFKKYLIERFQNDTFFLPNISSIQDYIIEQSNLVIPNELALMGILYTHFNKYIEEPFEQFHLWGKMILDDFDEIDKYLVDAKQLFESIELQKEIDANFELDPEKLAFVIGFWKNVEKGKIENNLKSNFIETWKILGDLYISFKDTLLKNKQGYEGMAYEVFFNALKNNSFKPKGKLTIAGFNALSVAEEEIFYLLDKNYGAQIHWDADIYYLKNKFQEAGNFLRRYQTRFNSSNNHWHISDSFHHKKINIYKGPLQLSQVKTAIKIISQIPKKELTATVLCNEAQLFPILYNLPGENNALNLTMGFPLKSSHWFTLLFNIIELIKSNGSNSINKDGLIVLIQDPIIQKMYSKNDIDVLLSFLKTENNINIQRADLFNKTNIKETVIGQIIGIDKAFQSFVSTITNVFHKIYYELKEILNEEDKLLFFGMLENFNQFNALLIQVSEPLSFASSCRLLHQYLQRIKIPFEYAETDALQIMGFLESRSLDFENLIILGANEGNLPAGGKRMSFIPYNLRRGFGLPTFEEHDAIYAYHFYRLLQRAKNISLIYDTQQGENSKEKSRFILQLLNELDKKDNTIETFSIEFEAENFEANHLLEEIQKTPETMAILEKMEFSPTALSTYISNPMEFYLKYIAKLDPTQQSNTNLDPLNIGNLIHKTMENIYLPFKNKVIEVKDFEQMEQSDFISQQLNIAGNSPHINIKLENISGKDILAKSFMISSIAKIIKNDKKLAPFSPIYLEEKIGNRDINLLLNNGKQVFISGKIDRIDQFNENNLAEIRIIDYKTGEAKLPKYNEKTPFDINVYFDEKFKFGFQGLFYAYLLFRKTEGTLTQVSFYSPKSKETDLISIEGGNQISIAMLKDFEHKLKDLIEEILNPAIPFISKKGEEDYKNSNFRDLIGI